MARARIATMKPLLVGKDPLAIEVHFQNMTSLMHTYIAHIPTISGIDLALWDLAGKITGLPICTLLGGPFRESIRMYSHGVNLKMLDKNSCRDFAARVKSMPEGFNAFKCGIDEPLAVPTARFTGTLDQAQLRMVARAFNNVREAPGDDIEIAVHGHDEFDEPSAVGIGKAVEPMNPLFIEDLLSPAWSPAWQSIRRQIRTPLLNRREAGTAAWIPAVHRQPDPGHYSSGSLVRRRLHRRQENRQLRLRLCATSAKGRKGPMCVTA